MLARRRHALRNGGWDVQFKWRDRRQSYVGLESQVYWRGLASKPAATHADRSAMQQADEGQLRRLLDEPAAVAAVGGAHDSAQRVGTDVSIANVQHPLPGGAGYCVLVENVLGAAACTALIRTAQVLGFRSAGDDYPPSYRDNERLVRDDAALADRLLRRFCHWLPRHLVCDGQRWRLLGLNPRLRFCRYAVGQQFRIHQDGVRHVSAGERSLLTFMLYLDGDESFSGGDTVFYAGGPGRWGSGVAEIARVRPRRGSLIVFDHSLWHAGDVVTAGCKHVLRSDLIYRCEDTVVGRSAPVAPGHSGYVWALQRLGDGGIASGGRDGQIRLWDRDGRARGVLHGHTQSVLALAPVGAGGLASLSRDRELRLWDPVGGQCLRRVVAHAAAGLCLGALGDGRLASGGADGTIALWDAQARLLCRLPAQAGWVWALAVLDVDRLISATEGGSVRLWSLSDGGSELLQQGETPLRALALRRNRDGAMLAVGDAQGQVRILCEAHGWRESRRFDAHSAAVRCLRWLADGRLASGGEDGAVRVWDGPAHRLVAQRDNFVCDVLELDDGRLLVAGYDGRLLPHTC